MPTLTFTVTYDGTDPAILQALSRMASALGQQTGGAGGPQPIASDVPAPSSTAFEKIAARFAAQVSRRSNLTAVMRVWIQNNGKAPLSELVRASGVKTQHDYSGIGSALTRNMKKAGGPKDWYDGREQSNGDWLYEIADELIEPLKRAFRF